jgi:peptidyl-prolyl cis-trans isomerase D
MLKALSRLERTRNIVILLFAVLMAVSLVIFYAPGRSSSGIDPSKNTEVVAKVGSRSVTVADVARVKESYTQRFGNRINLAQLGGTKGILNGLIGRHVIAQEAERLGLGASDAELAEKIRKRYVDASGKFVGDDRYKEIIISQYGDLESFETELRDEISQDKLRAFVIASVNVSDAEVEEEYKRRNTSFDVSYIAVSADKLAEKIQPSDDELKTYYESHKSDYRFLEPQKKVQYVFINTEKVGSTLQIADADLKQQFDSMQPQFKEAGVKVQQILLKVARKDLDAQVEQKAKDLIAKLRGPKGQTTKEAFADAARGNSEDPATAQNGGFLAKPFKKNPNKPDSLYDRTVDMQVGEVSDIPIRYGGNWYILRRDESVQKTFAEAKPELLVSARNSRGYNAAFQLAQKAKKRLDETKDPQKVAQEFAGEAHMAPAEMVRETAFIKPGDDVPEVGSNQQFEDTLEPLNNPKDVGEAVGIKNGFAIPMLVEKREPRIPEFDEVKSKVADAIKQQRAKDQLEQKAKDILASVTSPDGIKAAGEKEGFDSGAEESFKLGSSLGKAGISSALDDLIYSLKPGEFSKTPLRVEDKWVIVGVTKRYDADQGGFANQRDTLKTSLISQRQDQVFEDYIGGVQQRMKKDGKIEIYQKVLDQLEEPAAEPILPAGLNLPQ